MASNPSDVSNARGQSESTDEDQKTPSICPACQHSMESHDPLGVRFCAVTATAVSIESASALQIARRCSTIRATEVHPASQSETHRPVVADSAGCPEPALVYRRSARGGDVCVVHFYLYDVQGCNV